MTPRPLHRWKSFWLGMLVLGFLGWAWAYSFKSSVRLDWIPESGRFFSFIDIEAGRVRLCYLPQSGDFQFEPKLDVAISPAGHSEHWFTEAWQRLHYAAGGGIELAHWFLILLFLVPWLGFLVWRGRKEKKPNP